MTAEPVASVVVCVHNRPEQVLRCLNSLLALKGPPLEIVLVDDGSTDETPRRLEQFRCEHPDAAIRIVRNERNLGVSGARNAGIDAARGEFVAFTDSDCTVGADWLSGLVGGFSAPQVAAVAGPVDNVPLRNLAERAAAGLYRMRAAPAGRQPLVGCNMAFRRAVIVRYRFDPSFRYNCDETDVAYRLQADGHRTGFVPAARVAHDHPLTLRKYVGMAHRQGCGSARFWYKTGQYLGPELWPAAGMLLSLPLGLLTPWLLAVPAAFLALQLTVIAAVELFVKGFSAGEAASVFPLDVIYYACRIWAVFLTLLRIALGGEPALRRSKRDWLDIRVAGGGWRVAGEEKKACLRPPPATRHPPPDVTRRVAFALPAGAAVGGVETWSIRTAERLRSRDRDAVLLEYPLERGSAAQALAVSPDLPRVACRSSNWGQIQPANLEAYRSVLPAVLVPNYSLEGYGICAVLAQNHADQMRVIAFCHSIQKFYVDTIEFYEPILHKIVAVSEECAEVLRRRLPHRSADMEVRPYPVEVPENLERSYSGPGEPLRLLYAGRVVEQQKRVSDLLLLAERLHQLGVDFRLLIVGEGESKRRLDGKIARLDPALQAKVSLRGGVPHGAVQELLRESDVAVLVSAYEGTSIFMLEALAWGCVPVVTEVSGTKAVVRQGVTGYRVPVGAIGEMAAFLVRLASDRDHLRALGAAGNALARSFAAGPYQEWFENLIDSAWQAPPRSWPRDRSLFRRHQAILSFLAGRVPCAHKLWRAWLRYYRGKVRS